MSVLGQQMRARRKEKGLRTVDVGAALGVNDSTVGRWERGINQPSPDELARWAALLGVEIVQRVKLPDERALVISAEGYSADKQDLAHELGSALDKPSDADARKLRRILRSFVEDGSLT